LKTDVFVEKLRSGDEKAFEKLVKTCEKRVYLLALRYTNNPSDAMDISQETFVKAFRSIRTFKGDSAPETWVYRIAVNTALDFVRRTARKNEMPLQASDEEGEDYSVELPDESYAPDRAAEQLDLRETLNAAIAQLPEEQRQVVILRDVNDLPYGQIGQILGLNEGTVKSRLFRARAKLAEILRKSGNFPASGTSNTVKGGGRDA